MVIQLEIPDEKVRELDALAQRVGLPDRRSLFNNAITMFEWMVNELELRRIVGSIDEKARKYKELHMPCFDNIQRKPETEGLIDQDYISLD